MNAIPRMPPPCHLDMEQIVLGGLLRSGTNERDGSATMRAEDFADPVHGAVFRAIEDNRPRYHHEGAQAGFDAVRAALADGLAAVGGVSYLGRLIHAADDAGAGGCVNAAALVSDAAARRRMIDVADDLRDMAAEMTAIGFEAPGRGASPFEASESFRHLLIDVGRRLAPRTSPSLIGEIPTTDSDGIDIADDGGRP